MKAVRKRNIERAKDNGRSIATRHNEIIKNNAELRDCLQSGYKRNITNPRPSTEGMKPWFAEAFLEGYNEVITGTVDAKGSCTECGRDFSGEPKLYGKPCPSDDCPSHFIVNSFDTKGCEGCRFIEPSFVEEFCYMFEKAPEKLPCAQHDKYKELREANGKRFRRVLGGS